MDSHAHQRQHHMVTFAVLAMGTLSFVLLQSMVLPALPTIQRQLHTSADGAAWVLTAYLLTASVATPIIGRLGDIFGKDRLLMVVLAALVGGMVVAAFANSLGVLLAARALQGIGGAVFPLAFGIVHDEFPPERESFGIGLISMIIGAGGGLGIIIGGPVVEHLSVHWLFWLPLPPTVLALAATIFFVPKSPIRSPGGVNIPGAVLLSGWLLTLLVAISEAPLWGWGSARVIGLAAMSIALFYGWIRVELGATHPLVDIRMMRIPSVWWTNISALLVGVGMYASIVVIPPFLQTATSNGYGFGVSPARSGLFLVPQAVAMVVVGLVNGRVMDAIGAKMALIIGCILSGISFAILLFAYHDAWDFYVSTAISGVGFGLAFAAMPNLVMDAVPDSHTGIATGMNANIRTVGGAIGSQVVASILASGVAVGAAPHLQAYVTSFAVLAAAFALAAVAAVAVPRRTLSAATADLSGKPTGPLTIGR